MSSFLFNYLFPPFLVFWLLCNRLRGVSESTSGRGGNIWGTSLPTNAGSQPPSLLRGAPRSHPAPQTPTPHRADPKTPHLSPRPPTLRRGRAPPCPGGSASGAGTGAGASPRARPRPFRRSSPHARPWPQPCCRDRPRPCLVPWGLLGSPRVSSGPLGAQVPPHPSSEAVTAGTETTGNPQGALRCSSGKRFIKA